MDTRFLSNHQMEVVEVARGSLLQVDNPYNFVFDQNKTVSVTVSVLEIDGVKLTVLVEDLVKISVEEFQLLSNLNSKEMRLKLVTTKGSNNCILNIRVGDLVSYRPPRCSPIPAIVRYIGPVPELVRCGHLLGVQVIEPDWVAGNTDGSVGGRSYFCTEKGKGVFCDIGALQVKTELEETCSVRVRFQSMALGACAIDDDDKDSTKIEETDLVDWSNLANNAKASVDADIKHRQEKYNKMLKLKTDLGNKSKILFDEIKKLKCSVETDGKAMENKNKEINELKQKLVDCENEKRTLQIRIEKDQNSIVEGQSKLDVLNDEIKNLADSMKNTFISNEEKIAKANEDLIKANAEKDSILQEVISAKKASLECPVCLETAAPPIYKCPKEHLVCSKCLTRIKDRKCPKCRTVILKNSDSIFRLAEENWNELQKLMQKIR